MGFLDALFRPKLRDADLSVLKTDVHSHLIPGIDDGSTSLEDSLNLIRSLHSFGFTKLITTPHIMSDFYRNTPEIIRRGLEEVREAVYKEGIPVTIEAAAEYYCDTAFEKNIGKTELLTFSGKYVLIELSYMNPSENFESATFKLQMEGYIPVLAHPERYPYWYHSFDRFPALKDKGVLLAINLMSLVGHYGTGPRRIAERLIEHDLVSLLCSDTHKMSHMDVFKKALKEQSLHNLLISGTLINESL